MPPVQAEEPKPTQTYDTKWYRYNQGIREAPIIPTPLEKFPKPSHIGVRGSGQCKYPECRCKEMEHEKGQTNCKDCHHASLYHIQSHLRPLPVKKPPRKTVEQLAAEDAERERIRLTAEEVNRNPCSVDECECKHLLLRVKREDIVYDDEVESAALEPQQKELTQEEELALQIRIMKGQVVTEDEEEEVPEQAPPEVQLEEAKAEAKEQEENKEEASANSTTGPVVPVPTPASQCSRCRHAEIYHITRKRATKKKKKKKGKRTSGMPKK